MTGSDELLWCKEMFIADKFPKLRHLVCDNDHLVMMNMDNLKIFYSYLFWWDHYYFYFVPPPIKIQNLLQMLVIWCYGQNYDSKLCRQNLRILVAKGVFMLPTFMEIARLIHKLKYKVVDTILIGFTACPIFNHISKENIKYVLKAAKSEIYKTAVYGYTHYNGYRMEGFKFC